MTTNNHRKFENRLLAALPPEEQDVLEPYLERLTLKRGWVIYDPERRIEAVYFPIDCVVSILSVLADGTAIETATIGNEGMAGLPLFHGVERAPEQAYVQLAGDAYRMEPKPFQQMRKDCPAFTAALHRYTQALFTLAAQSSACNRMHTMEQRCARWLLLVHDRVPGDEFEMTQSNLSQMLGVRRATVTEAALELQRAGAIDYSRGRITVTSRAALEGKACECYGIVRNAFDYLVGDGERSPSPLAGVVFSEGGHTTARCGRPPSDARDDEPVADATA